ncbi:hypothetical protein [Staphylococcus intermedius]|uniref:Uncharacterized protein n=1 Tax=Staphylococcus intermedius NCTC 11048 TaxID=1141106 RepID=A0A380G6T2_STAIN|nr:hypothetical protein [Staphylococcus intermedius]PCF64997.1 hypothetical protein B5C04_02805 [Staphylococcus intermedius]PCF80608.1 hypothetical protein B4W74_02825 [Staphylococcus intermedius]PCF81957.1 hypothetical protein B4W70_02805 [Staphylococcus intermedius]PCF88293.1 hypothetical protein B4W75_05850 [Staphylococcus intermedius]PCF89008.1 hypothetical protein B4W76_01845 [Staphylococcus intermedius]
MNTSKKEQMEYLVQTLIDRVPHAFKFHGEMATHLFLNDQLYFDEKVEICVNRNALSKILRVIPKSFSITGMNSMGKPLPCEDVQHHQLSSVEVYDHNELLMNIIIYDVDNELWLFRLNHNVRIPEKYIYYHSLKWKVDYIKPEIVLMYLLHEPFNDKKVPFYRHLIDKMSYFQFVTLKVAVGEDLLKRVITERST